MPAPTPSPHPALLAALAAAALSVSSTARAEPMHPQPHKAAGHAHAGPHRPPGHGGRTAPVVRHAPPPPPPPPPAPAPAIVPPPPARGTSTGLPLPRFAALRADSVYLRRGPGSRYPIEWVYKRRDLPVRIEREFDVWRLIEDPDGVKGWVHQATLVGTRSFVILGPAADAPADPALGSAAPTPGPPGSQVLRSAPQPDASPVAVLEPGVIGRMRNCAAGADWCRVTVKDYAGWLPRRAVWGLLPDETVPPP